MRPWPLVLCLAALSAAAEFTGPGACASCHPAPSATQPNSRHARALRPIGDTPLPALLSGQELAERSGITFLYRPEADGVRVEARQQSRAATMLLEWAFGAGAQAYTPVGMAAGRFIEHRISWYTAAQGARRTLGHPGTPSSSPAAALGIVQDADTIYRCFHCHATGVRPGPDLRTMRPGVTCERCHGPASEHLTRSAARPGVPRTRDAVMELCGSCHRLPVPAASGATDPLSIRFAPVGLASSRCYKNSRTLSCVTCHDPHTDAVQNASHYEQKCLACHGQQEHRCAAGNLSDCVRCHMRKETPAPYLTFTDHRIRVYRE